jgi:hypothetical protein
MTLTHGYLPSEGRPPVALCGYRRAAQFAIRVLDIDCTKCHRWLGYPPEVAEALRTLSARPFGFGDRSPQRLDELARDLARRLADWELRGREDLREIDRWESYPFERRGR